MKKILAILLMCVPLLATTRSVTSFGAVGDGVTNNNTAIGNALAACANGDTTTFPNGTFLITAARVIPNGCTVSSSAGGILKGSFQPLLQGPGDDCHNITLSGMTLDGGGILFPIPSGSSAHACQTINILNNTFQNIVRTPSLPPGAQTDGIYAPYGIDNSLISGNTFTNIYDASHLPTDPGQYPGWSEVCAGIWLYDVDNTTVTANTFTSTCQALHYTSRELGHVGLYLTNNTMHLTSRYGLEIQGEFAINTVQVEGNYYDTPAPRVNGQTAISLAIGGAGHTLINNSLQGPNQVNVGTMQQSAAMEVEGCYNPNAITPFCGFPLVQGNVAGHFDTAQLSGWNINSGWRSINNTWCDIITAVIAIETNGSQPAVNTGNVNTASCSGVTFPPPYNPTPPPPPPPATTTTFTMGGKLATGGLFAASITGGPTCTSVNGYSCRQTITFNGYAGGSTLTNYTAYVSGNLALATVANGGYVTNASGFDVVYTSDLGCTTPLSWETPAWSATTGVANYWVNVPSMAGTTTKIYRCIGKASVTTFQGGSTAWNSGFKGVWHMQDATSTTISDSTGSGLTLTKRAVGGPLETASGQIGNAQLFTAANGDYARNASASALSFTNAMTISCWFRPNNANTTQDLVHKGDTPDQPKIEWALSLSDTGKVGFASNNGAAAVVYSTTTFAASSWYLAHGTWDGTTLRVYLNGVQDNTAAFSGTVTPINNQLDMGLSTAFTTEAFDGTLDEVRASNVVRSADWIAADYKNMNSPGSFYAVTQ